MRLLPREVRSRRSAQGGAQDVPSVYTEQSAVGDPHLPMVAQSGEARRFGEKLNHDFGDWVPVDGLQDQIALAFWVKRPT